MKTPDMQINASEQEKKYLNLKNTLEKSVGIPFDGPVFIVTPEEVKNFREMNNDPYGQGHDGEIVPQVQLLNTWASLYGSYNLYENIMKEKFEPSKFEIKALELSIQQSKPVPVNSPTFNKMTVLSTKPNDARKGVKVEIKYEVVLADSTIAATGLRTILINAL